MAERTESTRDFTENTRDSSPHGGPETRLGTVVLAVAFPLFVLLLYLPGTLYFTNAGEFTLRLNDLLLIFLPAWLFATACAVAVVTLLPARFRRRAVAVALALGLLLWAQGSLLVWRYGTLDGREVDWGAFWRNGLIDTPLWVLVLAAALLIPVAFVRIAHPAAAILIVVQSAFLVTSAGNAAAQADEASARNYSIDAAPKYSFSPERNVIVFVLDTFQSDVFAEILEREPTYAQQLDGFMYFPDAVTGSNYTELAVPSLLTGQIYDNSRPRDAFLREAYLEHGITTELKRRGFAVDVYPWVGWANESVYFDERIASNLEKIEARDDSPTFTEKKAKEALRLLDLALFRASPHFLKRWVFFSDQRGLLTTAVTALVPRRVRQVTATDDQYEMGTFIAQAPEQIPLDRGPFAFKYYHLKGVHRPLNVDEHLHFTAQTMPFSRRTYGWQAEANLRGLVEFFERLDQAGIYDDSLILVLGDHGSGETPRMYIGDGDSPERLEGTDRAFGYDKARAIPLVLIKRPGARGPLDVSRAPVSLRDVPATILAELGFDSGERGPSMFELDPGAPRVRHFAAFEISLNKSAYAGDITLYRIEGDSWRDESWTVEAILPPAATTE